MPEQANRKVDFATLVYEFNMSMFWLKELERDIKLMEEKYDRLSKLQGQNTPK